MARSLGVVECKSYVDLLKAADEIDKGGDVRFVRYENFQLLLVFSKTTVGWQIF